MSKRGLTFRRDQVAELVRRLRERRRHMQVVAGPRQVGKTTLVLQAFEELDGPTRFASADEPTLRSRAWIEEQWEAARVLAGNDAKVPAGGGAVLALDEIQKIPGWSETVKRLWDEDTRVGRPLHVVLLGSAPLLVAQGLTESLAGRFEIIRLPHWTFGEMQTAFGWDLERFVFHGGYPGAASLVDEPARWARYVLDSLVETSISRDVLLLSRVHKPALLRRLFELGCRYSGQILSYTKMLGQLQDAGNSTTLAHYLELLEGAGMLAGLPKFAGDAARQRGSSPKLMVFNTALMSAPEGLTLQEARETRELWGRLVESAIGAHLVNGAAGGAFELAYWRERGLEVDFVARLGRKVIAIEVKSGRASTAMPGMKAFKEAFHPRRTLLVGGDGIPIEEFLRRPAEDWIRE